MQGPTQRWDQPPDPRESTVSMPRIDPSSLAGQAGEPAAASYDSGAGMELPGFGDPYALPTSAGEPAAAGGPGGSSARPVAASAASSSRSSGRPIAAPVPAPPAELAVAAELAAPPEPAVESLLAPEVPPPTGTPAAGQPAEREAEEPEEPVAEEPEEDEGLAAPAASGQPTAISRGANPKPPPGAARRTNPGVAARPAPGSIAELRGRLERLPDGHPSSPYDDAGWLKPTPARLRMLELGLPARSLGTPAGYAERFGIDPDDDWQIDGPAPAAAAEHRPLAATAEDEPPGTDDPATTATDESPTGVGSARRETNPHATAADAVRGPVARPPKAPSAATRSSGSNGHRESGGGDGDGDAPRLSRGGTTPGKPPLPMQHPYADSAEPGQTGNGSGSGELALSRWPAADAPGDSKSRPGVQRNGHHPPAKLPETSRAETDGADRERRPPDPGPGDLYRSADGAPVARPRLAPELRDLLDRILAACRAAEGRNPRGGYGTSGLTPALQRIAAQLPAGGLAPGSEADTLKPADRLATRLTRLIDRQPGRPPAELAVTISDVIRYAFTFPDADYTEGTLLVHRKLKTQGFDLEARRNQWESREYKGVFTRWRDPAHGLAFEVQFHTADSWAVVKQTHDAYLRITDPNTPAAERARLRARQAAAAATVSSPFGCLDIADFRAVAR